MVTGNEESGLRPLLERRTGIVYAHARCARYNFAAAANAADTIDFASLTTASRCVRSLKLSA